MSSHIKHGIVYAEHGIYAGWPANHGAWQWGNEMLVGFLRGRFKHKSMHNIAEPFALAQARSLDGGITWIVEGVDIPIDTHRMTLRQWDRPSLDGAIIRVRGSYDHGGDFIQEEGCFFASTDKGATWDGPFTFNGIEYMFDEPHINTSRTSVIDDLVFMSRADGRMWGTDEVFVASYVNGKFFFGGTVAADRARAVMPAAARVGDRIVTLCRRRMTGRQGGWIEAFASDDGGHNWKTLGEVGHTGSYNGNPPALIEINGTLVCVYANRTDMALMARSSSDRGDSWSVPYVLRSTNQHDIGYPQLFKRDDGTLVTVYYWSDKERPHQHIAYTHFNP